MVKIMNKNLLLDELKKFIDSEYNIILIDGPWGSGKTYFWNHKVKNKIDITVKSLYNNKSKKEVLQ